MFPRKEEKWIYINMDCSRLFHWEPTMRPQSFGFKPGTMAPDCGGGNTLLVSSQHVAYSHAPDFKSGTPEKLAT
jgi:hypothetical protein